MCRIVQKAVSSQRHTSQLSSCFSQKVVFENNNFKTTYTREYYSEEDSKGLKLIVKLATTSLATQLQNGLPDKEVPSSRECHICSIKIDQ